MQTQLHDGEVHSTAMDRTLEGQIALITGGGKGIGLGIARALAARGARLALTGRDRSALDGALSSLKSDGIAIVMDVRNEQSIKQGIDKVVSWGGSIDILVNNAGIGLLDTPFLQTTLDQWRD